MQAQSQRHIQRLPAWQRLGVQLDLALHRTFHSLALSIAKRPRTFLWTIALVCFCLSAGFAGFRVTEPTADTISPSNNGPTKAAAALQSYFSLRSDSILIVASDGGPQFLSELTKFLNDWTHPTVTIDGRPATFRHMCLPSNVTRTPRFFPAQKPLFLQQDCRILSYASGSQAQFQLSSNVTTRADVVPGQTITNLFGAGLLADDVVKQLPTATPVRVILPLQPVRLADTARNAALVLQADLERDINSHTWSSTQQPVVASQSAFYGVDANALTAFVIYMGLVFVYAYASTLRDANGRFRLWFAAMAFTSSALAILATWGIAQLLGWRFVIATTFSMVICMGIGLDDAYLILNMVQSARGSPRQRLAHGLAHAAPALLMTSLTDAVVFAIGANSSVPYIQQICTITCATVIVDAVVQVTFFPAALYLDLLSDAAAGSMHRSCSSVMPVSCVACSRVCCRPGYVETVEARAAAVLDSPHSKSPELHQMATLSTTSTDEQSERTPRRVKLAFPTSPSSIRRLHWIARIHATTLGRNLAIVFAIVIVGVLAYTLPSFQPGLLSLRDQTFPGEAAHDYDTLASRLFTRNEDITAIRIFNDNVHPFQPDFHKRWRALFSTVLSQRAYGPLAVRGRRYADDWLTDMYAWMNGSLPTTADAFGQALDAFLADPRFATHVQSLVLASPADRAKGLVVHACMFRVSISQVRTTPQTLDAARLFFDDLARSLAAAGDPAILMSSPQWLELDSTSAIFSKIALDLLLSTVALFLIFSVFLYNALVSLVLVLTLWVLALFSVCVTYLIGFSFDTQTSLSLLLSFGSIVDYSAHVAHQHMIAVRSNPKRRLLSGLNRMGPVLVGAFFSTALATSFCIFISGPIRGFFILYGVAVISAFVFAAVLLPQLLLLLNPPAVRVLLMRSIEEQGMNPTDTLPDAYTVELGHERSLQEARSTTVQHP